MEIHNFNDLKTVDCIIIQKNFNLEIEDFLKSTHS